MASSKIDMALDDIIKMQKKSSRKSGSGRGADGDKNNAATIRKRGPSLSLRGRRAGVFRPARKNPTNGVIDRRMNGAVKKASTRLRQRQPVGQRAARNLVKRAMLRNRRQAIAVSRVGNIGPANTTTRHLVEQVRQWRNTAKLLHNALQIEASKNLRSPVARMNRTNHPINISPFRRAPRNSVQNRLGWQTLPNRSRGVRNNMNFAPKYNNQNFGSMRSDDMSRENERLKRITADVIARYGDSRHATSTGRYSRASYSSRQQSFEPSGTFSNNFRETRRFANRNNNARSNFNDRVGLKSFRGNNRFRGRRNSYGRYSQ